MTSQPSKRIQPQRPSRTAIINKNLNSQAVMNVRNKTQVSGSTKTSIDKPIKIKLALEGVKFKECRYNKIINGKAFAIVKLSINTKHKNQLIQLIQSSLPLFEYTQSLNGKDVPFNELKYPVQNEIVIKTNNFDFCSICSTQLNKKDTLDILIEAVEINKEFKDFTYTLSDYRMYERSVEDELEQFFIKHIRRVGEATVQPIMNKLIANFPDFDLDEINTLFHDKTKLVSFLTPCGVKEVEIDDIMTSWHAKYHILALTPKLKTLGIGDRACNRALKQFKEEAYHKLIERPHALILHQMADGRVYPILSWDEAENIKRPADSPPLSHVQRKEVALRLSLQQITANSGSTFCKVSDLIAYTKENFTKNDYSSKDLMEHLMQRNVFYKDYINGADPKAFVIMTGEDCILKCPDRLKNEWFIMLYRDLKQEQELLRKIERHIINDDDPLFTEEQINEFKNDVATGKYTLNKEQALAVEAIMRYRIAYLTGGPGTGKTYTLKVINEIFKKYNKTIGYVAPTAKAAQKMFGYTGEEAKTIHKMFGLDVEIDPDDDDEEYEGGAKTGEEILYDLLVCDESSMLDIGMFVNMYENIPTSMALLCVGDVDQLPSIARGALFRELIESNKIHGSRLIKPYRIDGDSAVAINARLLNDGKPCDISTKPTFEFIHANNDIQILSETIKIYKKLLDEGISPNDIQVLTPQKSTASGVDNMNTEIKRLCNPSTGDNRFDINDKVMHTKNNKTLGVDNGSVGVIVEISDEFTASNNKKVQSVKVKYNESDDERNSVYITYNEEKYLKQLTLSYAFTTHKSQGSDYKYVILVLSNSHWEMNEKALIYTAMTRVKNKLYCVGESRFLLEPSYLKKTPKRFTMFGKMLKENNRLQDTTENTIVRKVSLDNYI